MAKVHFSIGGYQHELSCRDGEEAHFRALAAALDAKATEAARAVGGLTELRSLLYAGLLLADENAALRARASAPAPSPAPSPPGPARETLPDPLLARAVGALADRIEALAAGLEAEGRSA